MASSRLLVAFLAAALSAVGASPPGPVMSCASGNANCTVTNTYGAFPDRSTCLVSAVAHPSTEEELLRVVSSASSKGQHMKVVTAYSHSIPKLSCPGGPAGAGLAISTSRLDKVVSAEASTGRMTVEAGMELRELVRAAAARGLALPHAPYWQGVTVGGLLATGSHGSSLVGKGSAVHEYVVGMRLVVPTAAPVDDGLFARVVELRDEDEDLLAAKVHLGVLGVVSQVTLQLQPMFKRSLTNRIQDDNGFESTITSFGSDTEFGDINWWPSLAKVIYRDDVRLPLTSQGNGVNDFIGFRPQPSIQLSSFRAAEENFEALEASKGKCQLSNFQFSTLVATGHGLHNDGGDLSGFHGYPVIGNQSDMQTSGSCLTSEVDELQTTCSWDPRINGLFFHQTAVSIPLAAAAGFISDVKKLRDADPDSLCGVELYGGFLMRYVRGSAAYLGKTADSLDVDITYYRSRDPLEPRLHGDVLEEIEQMALFKHGGLPHLGKNRNVGFLGFREKLGARAGKFVEAMRRFDPEGLFSSDWTDAVLGLRGKSPVADEPGCALEGMCICSKDEHCAPSKGYVCRPGVVYADARVCTKLSAAKEDNVDKASISYSDEDGHEEL